MWRWAKNGDRSFAAVIKQSWYHFLHALGFLKWNHKMIRHLYANPYSTLLKEAGFHDYTYAYAITKSGAEKLLKMQTPLQYIADNLLAHACVNKIVNGFVVYPPVYIHDNLPDGSARDSYIR